MQGNEETRSKTNDAGAPLAPSLKRKKRLAPLLLLTATAMLVIMIAYESLEQLLFPEITLWQSHIATIFFTTAVATVVAYFVIRKAFLLLERISEENAVHERSREALRLSEEKLSKLFHANPDWIIISRLADGLYLDVNEAFLRMTGYTKEEVIGHTSLELHILVDPENRKELVRVLERDGRISNREVSFRMKSGEIRSMLQSAERIELGGETCMISVCKDITERKKAEKERQELIVQLEESLSKVKLLSGFLPICASCKKIRTDQGYWEQIEVYIKNHSEAEFSHGLCPECARRLYPDVFKK